MRVLIADDVIATGGTARAALDLVRAIGCMPIGMAFLVELTFLAPRAKLGAAVPIHSVIAYDGAGSAAVNEG
jgi:adenine phosphoribosyltransferase